MKLEIFKTVPHISLSSTEYNKQQWTSRTVSVFTKHSFRCSTALNLLDIYRFSAQHGVLCQ